LTSTAHPAERLGLSDEHRRSLEVGSAIHPQVIEARGYVTVRSAKELEWAINVSVGAVAGGQTGVIAVERGPNFTNDPDDVTLHLAYRTGAALRKGRFLPHQLRFPALLIPLRWGPDGHIVSHRLRPDRPRSNGDGKPVKYEQPTGLPLHLDVNPLVWTRVLDGGPGWVAPQPVLAVIEGEKKADALASVGVPAVCLTGVWSWGHEVDGRKGTPLAEWEHVPLAGRPVCLVFDSDVATNEHVQLALTRLSAYLRERGARVWWTLPPAGGNGKVGVDDYLAAGGSWDQLVRQSVFPNPLDFRTLTEVAGTRRRPRWLVREVLLNDAFMVVGGAEKTLKSWIMVALAVAVASGRPLFREQRFAVRERRRVLVLSGEGTVDLFLDRVEHLCKLCEVDPAEVLPYVEVTDAVSPSTSAIFREGLTQRIAAVDPGLVILDPAYVYVDAGDRAGNVFSMGKLLADLRNLCRGRAVVVGHHFTKAGASDLLLASLTQAGFREVFDHWLLVAHASDPDLDRQEFRLHAKLGARRGFGWNATFEVILGPLDLDRLQHVGDPVWRVLAPEARGGGNGANWRQLVYDHVREEPGRFTKRELVGTGEGSKARAVEVEWLLKARVIRSVEGTKMRGNGVPYRCQVLVPAFDDLVLDTALERLRERLGVAAT